MEVEKKRKKKRKTTWMDGFVIGKDKKDPLQLSQQESRAVIADTYARGRSLYKIGS
mgnify:CR=1 FL=1